MNRNLFLSISVVIIVVLTGMVWMRHHRQQPIEAVKLNDPGGHLKSGQMRTGPKGDSWSQGQIEFVPRTPVTSAQTPVARSSMKPADQGTMDDLVSILGTDDLGMRVSDGIDELTALIGEKGLQASFAETSLVKSWISEPGKGVNEIRDILTRIPLAAYPEFRNELIRIAGLIPGENSGVMEIAAAEIRNNIVSQGFQPGGSGEGAVSPSILPVTTALRVWLDRVNDADQALRFTIDSILRQPDPLVRASFIASFTKRNPKAMEDLERELLANNIENPDAGLAVPGQ